MADRERVRRDAFPAAAIIGSQSVKYMTITVG
jgi:hypothetical protein